MRSEAAVLRWHDLAALHCTRCAAPCQRHPQPCQSLHARASTAPQPIRSLSLTTNLSLLLLSYTPSQPQCNDACPIRSRGLLGLLRLLRKSHLERSRGIIIVNIPIQPSHAVRFHLTPTILCCRFHNLSACSISFGWPCADASAASG